MPEFLIRNNDSSPRYARIDENLRITWQRQADGTPFGTEELAASAFSAACSRMWSVERAKAQKSLSRRAGGSEPDSASVYALAAQNLPLWLTRAWNNESDALVNGSFHTATRPSINDLLGVFEQFYVRSASGWLSRPQTLTQTGLGWTESFEFAVPFSSFANAQAIIGQHGLPAWVLRASCAFTAVSPAQYLRAHPEPEDLASAVAAACEARDISASLASTAGERFAAMEAAPGRARASRL